MSSERIIHATFDDERVIVYQAFNPTIADEALRQGTFGPSFRLDRMTWIKPSFGWMLHRSGYASKQEQERILAVHILHEGFRAILAEAVPSAYDPRLFVSEAAWREALRRSKVRFQWDIDRDVSLRPLDRRALQLGIRGTFVRRYAREWIQRIDDVTALAHAVRDARARRAPLPELPKERPYDVGPELAAHLGMA